ncbi:hypothetical protein AAMO2058_001335500 [Amorphochlora amoebiformis]
MEAEQYRALIAAREHDLARIKGAQVEALETLHQKQADKISQQESDIEKLSDDYKYNLNLLEQRDSELERYDKAFEKLILIIRDREADLVEEQEKNVNLQRETEAARDQEMLAKERLKEITALHKKSISDHKVELKESEARFEDAIRQMELTLRSQAARNKLQANNAKEILEKKLREQASEYATLSLKNKSKIDTLSNTENDLRASLVQVTERLLVAEERARGLESGIKEKDEKISTLENDLQRTQSRAASLVIAEKKQGEKIAQNLQESLTNLEESLRNLQSEKQKLQDSVEKRACESEKAMSIAEEAKNKQISKLEAKIRIAAEREDHLRSRIDILGEAAKNGERAMAELRELKRDICERGQRERETAERERENLLGEVHRLKAEVFSKDRTIAKLEGRVTALQNTIKQSASDMARVRAQKLNQDKIVSNMESRIESLIHSHARATEDLEAKIGLECEKVTLLSQRHRIAQENSRKLEKQASMCQGESARAMLEIQTLREQLSKEKEINLAAVEQTNREREALLREKDKSIEEKEKSIEHLQKQIDKLNNKRDRSHRSFNFKNNPSDSTYASPRRKGYPKLFNTPRRTDRPPPLKVPRTPGLPTGKDLYSPVFSEDLGPASPLPSLPASLEGSPVSTPRDKSPQRKFESKEKSGIETETEKLRKVIKDMRAEMEMVRTVPSAGGGDRQTLGSKARDTERGLRAKIREQEVSIAKLRKERRHLLQISNMLRANVLRLQRSKLHIQTPNTIPRSKPNPDSNPNPNPNRKPDLVQHTGGSPANVPDCRLKSVNISGSCGNRGKFLGGGREDEYESNYQGVLEIPGGSGGGQGGRVKGPRAKKKEKKKNSRVKTIRRNTRERKEIAQQKLRQRISGIVAQRLGLPNDAADDGNSCAPNRQRQ